ncbi:MAG TPA: cation:proton antiporter, partial [Candidatus Limnocylindrales bacterium]|nr:cation:proton antiporter [Candidatus Limnocylindrales bacterium]
PFITLFIALAVSQEPNGQGSWLVSALTQIGLAVLVGGVVGAVGGKLLSLTSARMWTSAAPLQFAVLGLAFASYLGSIVIGGNGFVAAFVGGLAFGQITRHQLTEASEYTETTGNLLSLFVWTVFGSILAAGFLFHTLDWQPILYAILSLTVIRVLPVILTLRGERLRRDTQVVVGWFGPRGLASVIFGLMAIEALEGAQMETELLGSVVAWTILPSVLAHGLSAQPLAGWYARRLRTAGPDIPELMDMSEVHNRHRGLVGAAGTEATDPHRHA